MSTRKAPPMTSRLALALRKHIHVLIVVPLVVIATTWPTFSRLFDADEFWLHVRHGDKWQKIWHAWHFEQALAGQTELYHTDMMFQPAGTDLVFQAFIFPHALLLIALKTILPVDDAYNLLFLLTLCFNAFCGYTLIRHFIEDKWIVLFGAVVFAVATPFPQGSTVPDLTIIGTLPLTLYFVIRALRESNWLFAVVAGLSAGITAFISVYVFAFILLSVGIFVLLESFTLWRQKAFWGGLFIIVIVCGLISAFRFCPMMLNRDHNKRGLGAYAHFSKSNDVLENFVLTTNPFTGPIFRLAFNTTPVLESAYRKPEYKEIYLGYINLFLIACAIIRRSWWRRLLPWVVILLTFGILTLGHYLTFNQIEFPAILLPKHFLTQWFPGIFGNIGYPEYYQIGVVTPLSVLACYGLAALVRSRPVKARRLILLLCIVVVCIEFYTPRLGETLDRKSTAFVPWLQSQAESQIKIINLPDPSFSSNYYSYLQTLTGYPHTNGVISRFKRSAVRYSFGNLLLRTWDNERSIHCLPYNEQSFKAALDQLLADGFTHIVLHKWLYGDQFIIQSFKNIPPAYDNGHVSVYRVRDMRLSCQNQAAQLPRFIHFAQSSMAAPGSQSAILSIHPDQPIDPDLFEYLGSLFSDWRSLVHLYLDNGELVMQSAGARYPDMDAFTNDSQVVHLLYNMREVSPDSLSTYVKLDGFNLCQREASDDGAVIEHYVSRDFSCELMTSSSTPFQVRYDNGIRLENLEIQTDQDGMDFQFMWSGLPDEAHSVSIQVFDETGEKMLGQDSVIGHITLDRQRIDISSLPPGDYSVKLIMYNFESGAIVGGTANEDGARFERELPIATLNRL